MQNILFHASTNEVGAKLMEAKSQQPYLVINGTLERCKELNDSEVVSTTSVTPLSKEVFASSLNTLFSAGVRIYFVDNAEFDHLICVSSCKTLINGVQ